MGQPFCVHVCGSVPKKCNLLLSNEPISLQLHTMNVIVMSCSKMIAVAEKDLKKKGNTVLRADGEMIEEKKKKKERKNERRK